MSKKGLISEIQHFSVGDGPGIRTTVFMQGCNLHCPWCHNPETMAPRKTLMWYQMKCVGCSLCAKRCPHGAISFENESRSVDDALCMKCGACEFICTSDAIVISGKEKTVEEVFDEIMKEAEFFEASGGGVTFSGGEPLLQAEFCAEVAKKCKDQNIHVLVDTAGSVPYSCFEKILPYCDMFYVDLKAADETVFSELCGGSLSLVKENMKRLATVANVTARMPIIPGYNDREEYIEACAQILLEAKIKRADLLPFHRMGTAKYDALGQRYAYDGVKPPESVRMDQLTERMNQFGIDCRIEK